MSPRAIRRGSSVATHGGVHPHEHSVVNFAAVKDCPMANNNVSAHNRRILVPEVNNRPILHVAPLSDANVVQVTTND